MCVHVYVCECEHVLELRESEEAGRVLPLPFFFLWLPSSELTFSEDASILFLFSPSFAACMSSFGADCGTQSITLSFEPHPSLCESASL